MRGRISHEDFERLCRRRVCVRDDSPGSFMRLLQQGVPPRIAGAQTHVVPPFTIVVVGTAADRDALYARIQERADFDTMCVNAGVLGVDKRRYATQERFFGCVGAHLNFESAYMCMGNVPCSCCELGCVALEQRAHHPCTLQIAGGSAKQSADGSQTPCGQGHA